MSSKNRLHPIPKPDGNPVIGNVLSVDPDAPLQALMEITRDLGPIFWLDMMGAPMVVVSGPELVKELCDESRFGKVVRGPLKRIRAVGGDGLFTGNSDDPNWSKAHNILMPTFSQKAMEDYLPMMADIADQLLLKWERMNADDEIDVVRDMTGLTLDTVGLCGFDYRFNSFYREDFHPFIGALNRTLETCMVQRGLPFEKVMLRKRLEEMGDDVSFMNKLVDDIVLERRHGGDSAQKDLLNFMLAGVDKVTGESLSDENIRYQINTFLIAGHETTSGLLSFTFYYLLKNPDVLAKAYAEVDEVLGNTVDAPVTIAQIGKLDYVRAVLLEALRLWPTAPVFSLSPHEDEVIGGAFKLKKNTFINVLIPMLHRDKAIWGENAEEFNPDNFSREAEAARPEYAYKPFGNGKRACIGRQFALQEAILVVGKILQRFKIFDHKNYQLKVKETLSLKPDGFAMKVKPRANLVRGTGLTTENDTKNNVEEVRRPKHGTPLCILYGSNLGTAEGFAREIAHDGDVNGFETTLAPLDDFAGKLPTEGAVIIVSASYNGTAPDNATQFVEWLEAADKNITEGVTYAVFGCGSRDWASTFQTIPRLIDDRMEKFGAKRLMPRGEADAREGLDEQFHEWIEDLMPAVGDALSLDIDFSKTVDAQPLYKVEITESVTANPVAYQAGAMPMKILSNSELQNHTGVNPSARSTRHIEIELPEGITYQTGDHLCVVPVNDPTVISRALTRFGFDEDAYIRVEVSGGRRSPFPPGSTFSVKRLAEVCGELQAVASRKDVQILASHTRCPKTKTALSEMAAASDGEVDAYRAEVFLKRKSILDLLEEFPACELPFAIFLEMVPWISPRYYSISSSPKGKANRCSITVGVVEGPAYSGAGTYKGVCSNYLRDVKEGDIIQAVVKEPSADFRLPDDCLRPIIMIGPGTGVAPFRGFVQERRALKDSGASMGDAMLFFGCRNPDQDFLYKEELTKAHEDGLIELHKAFSRTGGERVYVQDLVRKNGSKIWQLIEQGAIIYVCGDGANMEPDVKSALTRICAEEKDISIEQADLWMTDFAKQGRYVLDVWAGT
ncbi:bifunctional cytochrome P450/NADPH--P450 reductase [Kordiimonas aquimaris]|uniref:bifunctional cytochrome P450/NADPH--P450 reductase n=1 Tax=Kordiimonas aquimaris TaxID=707591 RepID=UPI0021CFE6F8|nr:cytochrome P450 [Kordiimonas aquimaris]